MHGALKLNFIPDDIRFNNWSVASRVKLKCDVVNVVKLISTVLLQIFNDIQSDIASIFK